MNKASCLGLLSNAVLVWNTIEMARIVERLRASGEEIAGSDLAKISPMAFHHIIPQPRRIVTLDGGRRDDFVVELWLAPNTAQPPVPKPTVTVPDDVGDNLLYDSFGVGYEDFGSGNEDDAAKLDGFALALKKESKSWGCIVAYAMAGNDQAGMAWDTPGTALKIARANKRYLVSKHHVSSAKVSLIDGGYGDCVVELWIMRVNARFDKGPFLYPDRLRPNRNGTLTIGKPDAKGMCCKACARGRTNPYMLKYARRHRALKTKRRNRTNRLTGAAEAPLASNLIRRRRRNRSASLLASVY